MPPGAKVNAKTDRSKVTVSRQKLYRKVWSKPMVHIAREFGVSNKGLSKICNRLNIPYPSNGYWAKKHAGKNTSQEPLPENDGRYPNEVTITRTVCRPLTEKEKMQGRIKALVSNIKLPIPESFKKYHPSLVKLWEKGYGRYMRLAPELKQRINRILHVIFEMLPEYFGQSAWQTVVRETPQRRKFDTIAPCIILGSTRFDFDICEQLEHKIIPLLHEDPEYNSGHKNNHVYTPTGLLMFKVYTKLPCKLWSIWKETPDVSLESMLPQILSTIIVSSQIYENERQIKEEEMRLARERAEIEERLRIRKERFCQIQRERRRRADRRKRIKKRRCIEFMRLASAWNRTNSLYLFIKHLKSQKVENSVKVGKMDFSEWIAWAENIRVEPTCGDEFLWQKVFRKINDVH